MPTYAALRDALDEYLTVHLGGLENEQRVEALAWYCQGLGFETEAKTALGLAAAYRHFTCLGNTLPYAREPSLGGATPWANPRKQRL